MVFWKNKLLQHKLWIIPAVSFHSCFSKWDLEATCVWKCGSSLLGPGVKIPWGHQWDSLEDACWWERNRDNGAQHSKFHWLHGEAMPKQLGWEQKGTGAWALEVAPGWVWKPTPNRLSHRSFLKHKLCLQDGHVATKLFPWGAANVLPQS